HRAPGRLGPGRRRVDVTGEAGQALALPGDDRLVCSHRFSSSVKVIEGAPLYSDEVEPGCQCVSLGQGGTVVRILIAVDVDGAGVRRLESLPGAVVQIVSPHEHEWDLPDAEARGAEVLLCKYPPRDLDAMTSLKLLQLSTVGYE